MEQEDVMDVLTGQKWEFSTERKTNPQVPSSEKKGEHKHFLKMVGTSKTCVF